MTTPFTPGPWSISCNQVQSPEINDYGNWIVASIDRDMTPQDEANLLLLASAPELLAALNEIVSQIDQGGSGGKVFSRDACISAARSAIAKATGSPV